MSLFKKGLDKFAKTIKTYEITEKNIEKALKEFHFFLIRHSVGVDVSKEIIRLTKAKIIGERATRLSNMQKILLGPLKESILEILTPKNQINLLKILEDRKKNKQKEPLVVLFLGINGTGKTTTIAKVGYMLKKAKIRSVIAAADTFRSGAQEQISEHANRLKIRCIQGKYGGDPSSVAYDAIQHAIARHLDVVLIDTAGRMAINHDLIGEMKKIKRISNPDITFYIGDALTGNDATNQAREFDEKVGIDASILCKVDADKKSGASLSISYATNKKPISYIGVGQKYSDLQIFSPKKYIETLFN
ncbi:MAG: signal recognition particle-docking protein FtsY [Candidatus Hodarchaeales archaeon]|jgi:fused signal recognition particle receptor